MHKLFLHTKTIKDAITLHPVKDPTHMYRLHVYCNKERIQDLQQQGVKLQRVLRNMDWLIETGNDEKRGFQDARDFDHQLAINNSENMMGNVYFQIIIKSWSSYPDVSLEAPIMKIRGALRIDVDKVLEKTREIINEEDSEDQHLGKLNYLKINYGHWRFHTLYGIQHIVQATAINAKKDCNITGKMKTNYISQERSFYIQKPFSNYYLNSMRDLRALNLMCHHRNLRLFDVQRRIISHQRSGLFVRVWHA